MGINAAGNGPKNTGIARTGAKQESPGNQQTVKSETPAASMGWVPANGDKGRTAPLPAAQAKALDTSMNELFARADKLLYSPDGRKEVWVPRGEGQYDKYAPMQGAIEHVRQVQGSYERALQRGLKNIDGLVLNDNVRQAHDSLDAAQKLLRECSSGESPRG
jgi:hypothetical protein